MNGFASHDERADRNKQKFDPKAYRTSTQRAEPDARRDALKLGAVWFVTAAQETRRITRKIACRPRNGLEPRRCG